MRVRCAVIAAFVLSIGAGVFAQEWVEFVSRGGPISRLLPGAAHGDADDLQVAVRRRPARAHLQCAAGTEPDLRQPWSITATSKRFLPRRRNRVPGRRDVSRRRQLDRSGLFVGRPRGRGDYATWQFMQRDAKVTYFNWNNVDLVEGHMLTLTNNKDKSRTSAAIYMHENRLYILEGTVPDGYPSPRSSSSQSRGSTRTATASAIRRCITTGSRSRRWVVAVKAVPPARADAAATQAAASSRPGPFGPGDRPFGPGVFFRIMSTTISTSPPSALSSVPLWINGRPTATQSVRFGDVTNPATGSVVRVVPFANIPDVDAAVAAATAAFPTWRATPPVRRARILTRFRELVERDQKALAAVISEEHGKVFLDAMGEVQRGIEVVEFACGAPHLLKGAHSPAVGRGVDGHSRLEPLGVCAGITPFNFPAMVPMWMFPVALACGNTFLLSHQKRIRRRACTWRNCSRRPACPTACSTSCTAIAKPWTLSCVTPASRPFHS